MKLNSNFEFIEIDDSIIGVPLGDETNKYIIKLNRTAKRIFELLKDDITEKEIVDCLSLEYNVEIDVLQKFVHEFVENLVSKGMVS